MRDTVFYIKKAMQEQGISSQRKLAYLLDVNHVSVNQWVRGRGFPGPDYMIKLAEMANIPAEIALADLHSWHIGQESLSAPFYKKLIEITEKATGFATGGAV